VLKARKCIQEMREYHSPLDGSAEDLRLDMNESTTGCSPRVLAKMRSLDAKTLARYPSREHGESLVADFLGLRSSEVLLTNGADEAIDLLCRAYLDTDDELIIVVPAFAMYEIFAQGSAAKVIRVPAEPDFAFPTARILQAISPRTSMVIITNPNNPTGALARREDILKVLAAAPDAAVLLDEAYFDFCGQTMMDQVGKIPNLFVARTFSKAYGLAGVRLGVLAGDAAQISVLRRACAPFNVNLFALECLAEALADQAFIQAYVQQVKATREWLHGQLESLGLKCWPSQTNFLLCDFGAKKGDVLGGLRSKGISLRDRPDLKGCVRISIGTQEEMERVLAALKQVMQPGLATKQVMR
jgi:histidinol-phosphate aminotransferase